jgi:hypothetical protein
VTKFLLKTLTESDIPVGRLLLLFLFLLGQPLLGSPRGRAAEADGPIAPLDSYRPPQDIEIPRPAPVVHPGAERLEASIQHGVDYLCNKQNKNGSWGSPRRTKALDIYAPVPGAHHGFRAAVTCMAVTALIQSGDQRPKVQQAIDRGEAWILKELPKVRRANATALYNIWAHAYSLQTLMLLQERAGGDQEKSDKLAQYVRDQIELLTRYESVNGGWGYYDFTVGAKRPSSIVTSFSAATCVIELQRARKAGFEVPALVTDKAVASIKRQRKPDFSYLYGAHHWFKPMYSINRPGGSLGRSQVCNLALRRDGDRGVTDQVFVDWLDRLFARKLWLDLARKRPIPHESYFAVAGYFVYYAYYYGSGCMLELPEEQQAFYKAQFTHLLLGLQESDGCWWDFPLYDYHQSYGTAFAIMTLVRCR